MPALHGISSVALARELLRRLQLQSLDAGRQQKVLGRLAAELGVRTQRGANRFSVARSLVQARKLLRHPDFTVPDLAGAVCVDLGCGTFNPLGGVFALILLGAARGIGIDTDPVTSVEPSVRALYDCAASFATGVVEPSALLVPAGLLQRRLAGFDLAKLARGDVDGVDATRLEFRIADAKTTQLEDASIDVVTSKSFLEHIDDPDAVLAELARITRPGGLAFHAIDGFDHRHWGNHEVHPLEFLREPPGPPIVHGCNRLRPLEFSARFERHGFDVRGVVEGQHVEITPELRASLAEPYRDLPTEVLAAGAADFYLRRR
ncbi:MAG: class I SAM-dependent methyltransferase [Planctomycetota bacterium]